MVTKEKEIGGLDLLRKKFEPHHISKLPKQAKWMTEKKDEYKNCDICGGRHHPKAVHLDYVGHAALTDRLLDCDPEWNWEPVAFDSGGSPLMDQNGGMWIRLTVCGVSRIGYGHPDGKRGGDAVKEVIGDALRNAAMRFGAALDLWHKGDLHALEESDGSAGENAKLNKCKQDEIELIADSLAKAQTPEELQEIYQTKLNPALPRMDETQKTRLRGIYGDRNKAVSQAPLNGAQQ